MKIINLGNILSNNYIIKMGGEYLLIDTGYPEQYDGFIKKLYKYNIHLEDISYILLTHAHDDHAGFLNKLLNNSNAKVILNPKAVVRLKRGQNSFKGGCSSYLALLFCKVMKLLGKGDHKFPTVDRLDRYIILNNSNKLALEEKFNVSIINLPGHTSDSIGLLLEDGTLFCGDAAMNGFPSLNKIIIWIEDIKEYKKSWKLILEISPKKIYPSHGKPFMKEELKKNINKIDNIKLYPLKNKSG